MLHLYEINAGKDPLLCSFLLKLEMVELKSKIFWANSFLLNIDIHYPPFPSPSLLLTNSLSCFHQASEWLHDPLQPQEGEVQERWLLLEEKERWEDHPRGPHEAQSSGSRGNRMLKTHAAGQHVT